MLLLLCQSYQDSNTLTQANQKYWHHSQLSYHYGNKKKVSDVKTQQKKIAVIKSVRVSSKHQSNLLSKLKASWQEPRGVADELTMCL